MLLGCNYWASHAGIRMWRYWNADIVKEDLQVLASHGVNTLRVFPTWDDFQPVEAYYGGGGVLKEYRMSDGNIPQSNSFLDETMLNHFEEFCEICDSFHIRLIVGLLTGWMSGRLFIPSALNGKDVYTDPCALLFEQRFIRGFVSRFRDQDTIFAWDLGNECNCMGLAESREIAANWTGIISNAIRANDSSRPVISGMHGLSLMNSWNILDQGEYTDILTTHPYPYFVPHCSFEPVLSVRTLLHATCETKYYAALSGKPCLVEELGTLGPMMCSDSVAANFLRVNLFSNWAHGAEGVLWWCANDQTNLTEPPFSWQMCERELGLMKVGRQPKPTLQELGNFSEWLSGLDFTLPPASVDGVCIATQGQDQWGVSYMSYALGKMAGVNITFSYAEQSIPDTSVYLLPSVCGTEVMPQERYDELREKVKNGATLYLSIDDAFLSEFEALTGLRIKDTAKASASGNAEGLFYEKNRQYFLQAEGAEILKREENGNPLFTRYTYGSGSVYFLNFPMEKMLLTRPNAFQEPYAKIYEEVFQTIGADGLGITTHTNDSGTYRVMINYTEQPKPFPSQGKTFKLYRGDGKTIPPYDCSVIQLLERKA